MELIRDSDSIRLALDLLECRACPGLSLRFQNIRGTTGSNSATLSTWHLIRGQIDQGPDRLDRAHRYPARESLTQSLRIPHPIRFILYAASYIYLVPTILYIIASLASSNVCRVLFARKKWRYALNYLFINEIMSIQH